jgi:NAD+ diphosphatase
VEDEEGAPDQTELSEVRWFTRAQARDLIDGKLTDAAAPGRMAIAHQLIKAWVEEG